MDEDNKTSDTRDGEQFSTNLEVPMYFIDRAESLDTIKPYNFQYYPKEVIPRHNFTFSQSTVRVQDMRSLTPEPSLDTEGFAIYNVPTTMMRPDFANDTKVQDLYCREIEKYFFEALGAKHIRALDYQARYQIITVWRPFEQPVRDWPLAICDARTVDTADLIPSDVIYPTFVTENYLAHYNEQNQWYWLPDHKPNEVLVFKALDSAQPDSFREFYTCKLLFCSIIANHEQPAACVHGAFPHPQQDETAPARESIDMRLLVLYADLEYPGFE
ncbi:hypothetical protein CSUB01_09359 [Colletotrichum sublineola]|uniref:Methyltransferase n=1 Tax=Colletotrichum sublineola TaxID=1173701 RepID=A0A066XT65_COLSU|nr:hypothetical protein CSUB01_09359 [Colletotrichum sublineola]